MPRCKNCGAEVGDQDVFCGKCGNPVSGKPVSFDEPEEIKHESEKKDNTVKPIKKKQDPFEIEEMTEVNHSSSRTKKAKLFYYALIGIIIIAVLLTLYGLGRELFTGSDETQEPKNCPFECCLSENTDNYTAKACLNEYASCENNECVLPACDSECCEGIMHEEKSCEEDSFFCENNTCIRKDCPFECCTQGDGYALKECENQGSCVNNQCLLSPCPSEFECCYDELEYEDKECPAGKTCVERECKNTIIEMIKGYKDTIVSLFKAFL
ncbi:MAG: zinc-ribbon domain-containing protein [Candidatus Woesearchaeota archaeon]